MRFFEGQLLAPQVHLTKVYYFEKCYEDGRFSEKDLYIVDLTWKLNNLHIFKDIVNQMKVGRIACSNAPKLGSDLTL